MIVNDAKLNKPIVGKSIYSRGFAKKNKSGAARSLKLSRFALS